MAPNAWVAPYLVILLCQLLNFALFQFAYPFIPLFLVELGESQSSAIAWTGLGQSLGSLALMLANPIWGARMVCINVVSYYAGGITPQNRPKPAWQDCPQAANLSSMTNRVKSALA